MRRGFLLVSVSVALVAVLVWRTRPWEALATGADWRPVGLVVALDAVVVAAWAVRSAQLMAAVGSPIPALKLVAVVSFANTINNVTPASAGEALRAVILRRRHGVPYERSTAVILVERLWAIWIMAVSAGAAIVGTIVSAPPILTAAAWVGALAAACAPAVIYRLGLRPLALIGGRLAPAVPADPSDRRLRARLGRLLREVDTNLASILTSSSVAVGFLGSTAVVFVAFALQLWLILLALGADISPVAAWAALGIATIAGVLSALPFGLGAADVVLTGLLVAAGVPVSVAGAAALLLRATVTLPLGLAGTASWIALNRGDRPGEPGPTTTEPARQ